MDTDRITGAAQELGGKVQGGIGDLTGDTKTQAGGRLNEAEGVIQNAYGQAKDAVRQVASEAAELAEDAYAHGGRYLRDGRGLVAHQVGESPIVGLLVAGAVGYLLAYLAHGRR